MIKLSQKFFWMVCCSFVVLFIVLFWWQLRNATERAFVENEWPVLASPQQVNDNKNDSPPLPPKNLNLTQTTSPLNETLYWEESGVLKNGEKTVYIFSPELLQNLRKTAPNGSSSIIGAVPVPGAPDKYYLSTSAIVNDYALCGFSNKIYILDTKSNQVKLFYEENDKTIPASDRVRGCNKDMNLVATQDTKIIFKYHTWETGGVCDRVWADPESTYYLDTADPSKGTRKFFIPDELYKHALKQVKDCKEDL